MRNDFSHRQDQGRVRLRARWAIAQGPGCQGAPKREKSEKSVWKSIIKGHRGPQNILAQGPEDPNTALVDMYVCVYVFAIVDTPFSLQLRRNFVFGTIFLM